MISLFANLQPVLLLDTVQPSPSAEPSIEKYIREQHMYMWCDLPKQSQVLAPQVAANVFGPIRVLTPKPKQLFRNTRIYLKAIWLFVPAKDSTMRTNDENPPSKSRD